METFYYCALDENSKTCPKQNICKRYTHKKGVPASEMQMQNCIISAMINMV